MEIANIIYYNRKNDKNTSISLRELSLRDEYDLENIFQAVKEATDAKDLLCRFRRMLWDEVDFGQETEEHIRFVVTDIRGNKNNLKFKKRKDK